MRLAEGLCLTATSLRPARAGACHDEIVIAVRAPLRVSLGGGGTDLPSYFGDEEGFVLSAAIDKHVWLLVSTGFHEGFRLKHLAWEEVSDAASVEHPILRVALAEHWNGDPLELASVADVPAGTGLGSSGAYAVCRRPRPRRPRGRRAGRGGLPAGDRPARTHGRQAGPVRRRVRRRERADLPARLGRRPPRSTSPPSPPTALRERFLLFYTGGSRSASQVLSDQVSRTLAGDPGVRDNLRRTASLARETCAALEAGDLAACGELMNESWETKRARSAAMVPRPSPTSATSP